LELEMPTSSVDHPLRAASSHAEVPATAATLPRALVPIPESQAYLGGIGLTALYELIKSGDLQKVNIGRRGFVTFKSLEAYVERISCTSR
jgi:hypothetical protein